MGASKLKKMKKTEGGEPFILNVCVRYTRKRIVSNDILLVTVDVFFDDAFDAHEDKEKGQDFNSYVKTFIDVFYKVGR